MENKSRSSIYEIDCTELSGKSLPLRQYEGRPMLIVNTASLCGYSSQFESLESIWRSNRDKGLVVIGVPSNDFGRQEPGDSSQIISLCTVKFGVTFPLLAKTSVSGPHAHPLFQWLEQEGGFLSKPRWNFYKYIVGRDGRLKKWFLPMTSPGRGRVEHALRDVIETNS